MILAVVVKVHEGSKEDKIANITVRSFLLEVVSETSGSSGYSVNNIPLAPPSVPFHHTESNI